MVTQIEKNSIDPAEKIPDAFFPCTRCAREKKTGSLFFWSWPGAQEKFCQRCIPHPGAQHCEIFMLDLDDNFQWVLEKISELRKVELPPRSETSRSIAPLAEEYFRCPNCQNLVSEFDVFEHPCDPRIWKG